MTEDTEGESIGGSTGDARESRLKRVARRAWLATFHWLDHLMDLAEDNWDIIRREADLFFGAALVLLGLFNFQSGKYCDGNAADYLSCTSPTTYYYYGALEIALILIGVFFILLWFFKRAQR